MGRGQRPGGQEEEDRRIGGQEDTTHGEEAAHLLVFRGYHNSLSLDIGRGEENYL